MLVTVCICTFRRPSVVRAIGSIAAQKADAHRVPFRLVVVDNDDVPGSEAAVRQAFAQYGIAGEYIHAPGRNISIARNAGMEAARRSGDWIAFIDDDEFAGDDWLAELAATAAAANADVVFGPVRAIYTPDSPRWIREGDFHSHRYLENRRIIRDGYTSNVLIRLTSPALRGQRFLESFGRSGGEDTEFFRRAFLRGAVMRFAAGASVFEEVATARASFRWLVRRSFRAGAAYGRAKRLHRPGQVRALGMAMESGKVLWSAAAAGLSAYRRDRAFTWLFRAARHAGALAYLLGLSVPDSYGGERSGAPD
jgi:succinoglycan biosynthesis protein ExoM